MYFLNNRFLLIPLALETSGVWEKEEIQLIHEIGNRITDATGEKLATKFLFQTLSINFTTWNVTSILRTLPPGKEVIEIFY